MDVTTPAGSGRRAGWATAAAIAALASVVAIGGVLGVATWRARATSQLPFRPRPYAVPADDESTPWPAEPAWVEAALGTLRLDRPPAPGEAGWVDMSVGYQAFVAESVAAGRTLEISNHDFLYETDGGAWLRDVVVCAGCVQDGSHSHLIEAAFLTPGAPARLFVDRPPTARGAAAATVRATLRVDPVRRWLNVDATFSVERGRGNAVTLELPQVREREGRSSISELVDRDRQVDGLRLVGVDLDGVPARFLVNGGTLAVVVSKPSGQVRVRLEGSIDTRPSFARGDDVFLAGALPQVAGLPTEIALDVEVPVDRDVIGLGRPVGPAITRDGWVRRRHTVAAGDDPTIVVRPRAGAATAARWSVTLGRWAAEAEAALAPLGPRPGGSQEWIVAPVSTVRPDANLIALGGDGLDVEVIDRWTVAFLLARRWFGEDVKAAGTGAEVCGAIASYLAASSLPPPVARVRWRQLAARERMVGRAPMRDGGDGHDWWSPSAVARGARVFDALAARVGHDAVWSALHAVYAAHAGRTLTWAELVAALGAALGPAEATWLAAWLQAPRLPVVQIAATRRRADVWEADLEATPQPPAALTLPVEFRDGDRTIGTATLTIDAARTTVQLRIPTSTATVVIDPDGRALRLSAVDRDGQVEPVSTRMAAPGSQP